MAKRSGGKAAPARGKRVEKSARYERPPLPRDLDLSHIAEDLRPLAVPCADLREDPKNARSHGKRNLDVTAASLAAFRQRKPIVVNARTRIVEAGNGTLRVALAAGWTHIAAVLVDDDKKTAAAFGLADNRSAELAEWGHAAMLAGVDGIGEAFDMDALGFDPAFLEEMGHRPADTKPDDEQGEEDENPNDDLPDGEGPKPPFPYFGGKRRVAGLVWRALGDVQNYVEPFAGSLAVLLGRPLAHEGRCSTVNDLDAYIANFWRAVHHAADEVAKHADWPVNETDLLARHAWLVTEGRSRIAALEADPEHCDAKVAGWWAWGIACWIGSGWCSGNGPHQPRDASQLPHLGSEGQGVNRKLPILNSGRGVNRIESREDVARGVAYMRDLASRLRDVRVCCGDWSRVVTDGALSYGSTVGVFLDPPYLDEVRTRGLYSQDAGGNTLAHDVRAWALERGDDPRYRIVLAGYEPEHEAHMPASWRRVAWRARRAYGTTDGVDSRNRDLERLWLSPHCLATAPAT